MFLESFNNSLTSDMLYGLLDSILNGIGAKCHIPKTLARCLKTKQKEILAFVSSIEQQNMQPNQQEIPKPTTTLDPLRAFNTLFPPLITPSLMLLLADDN